MLLSDEILQFIALSQNSSIDQEKILIDLINEDNPDKIPLIAFLLSKYIDLYINNIHLLGYIVKNCTTITLNVIYMLLLLKLDLGRSIEKGKEETIKTWLNRNNLKLFLQIPNFQSLSVKTKDMLNLYLDYSFTHFKSYLFEIIYFHRNTLFLNYLQQFDINPNIVIYLTIKYLNLTAYEILLDHGFFPNSLLLNKLLFKLKYYTDKEDKLSIIQLVEMLKITIKRGVILNRPQQSMLNSIQSNIKLNRGNYNNINSLQKLAFSIGINPLITKERILENLSKINLNLIKQAAFRCYLINISTKYNIYSFANSEKFSPFYHPITKSSHNEIDLVYLNNNGITWVFTTDLIPYIYKNKKNIFTNENLSKSIYRSLYYQRCAIKRLGMLKEPTDNKQVNNPLNYAAIFTKIASINGIDQNTINELNKKKINDILRKLNQEYLDDYSIEHIKSTFFYICFLLIRNDPKKGRQICQYLK